ncbi:PREDICTED: peptidoglycan-recognition protein LC-like [Nicrophorus vespilloides]|uniref:Peptidoglycan-recognition protein LC-like n=1 Tax=Nicrophorus vespilloides TaxID=110193 RepID=A0ABM1MPV4_NICVS|nr:PREDICTED: peptidoglycan-recognition protein LC-like [Nicrophorus vespilloides]
MVVDVSHIVSTRSTAVEPCDKYEVEIVDSSSEDESFGKEVQLRNGDSPPPSFGNIAVSNSTDVHFGNKTFYQGPVTIKQFLYDAENISKTNGFIANENKEFNIEGSDNPSFVLETDSNGQTNGKVPFTDSSKNDNTKSDNKKTNNKLLLGIAIAVMATSAAIILVVIFSTKKPSFIPEDSAEQDIRVPIEGPRDPVLSGKLKIISRKEWLAQPPTEPVNKLNLPVPLVIIHHTATDNCSNQAECTFYTRYIQTFHIESKHWWDIGYNFLVGGDGFAYEGRGWESEGAHSFGYNARSIGIAFIGTFNSIEPPKRQIIAAQQLIHKGIKLGYVAKDYKLVAARQLQTTQSPGETLLNLMKTWDNWAQNP